MVYTQEEVWVDRLVVGVGGLQSFSDKHNNNNPILLIQSRHTYNYTHTHTHTTYASNRSVSENVLPAV